LENIPGDIGVVAVSGSQRTGKSFILNLLLDKEGNAGENVSPDHIKIVVQD
jgi:hypothetical protein